MSEELRKSEVFGRYKVASIDDEYAVVFCPDADADWMRIIARFRDQTRAEHMADIENDVLQCSETYAQHQDMQDEPPRIDPDEEIERVFIAIKDTLLDTEKFKEGVYTSEIARMFECSVSIAREAMIDLKKSGLAKCEYIGGRSEKAIFPPDSNIANLIKLTPREDDFLSTMERNADAKGVVTMSLKNIAEGAGHKIGGASQAIYGLETKGWLKPLGQSKPSGPNQYQLLKIETERAAS